MNKQHKKFDISKMTEFKPSNKSVEDQYDDKLEKSSEEKKEERRLQAAPFSSID
jgi:hypothetical protein